MSLDAWGLVAVPSLHLRPPKVPLTGRSGLLRSRFVLLHMPRNDLPLRAAHPTNEVQVPKVEKGQHPKPVEGHCCDVEPPSD
jgi:hypothetical protein